MNEQQLEELKAFVHNEMVHANSLYDRACRVERQVDIEFWGGKMEAFAMVENKIEAIIGGEKDEPKSN